jgi:hypothetical protein
VEKIIDNQPPQWSLLPEELMDEEGYPTGEWLSFIKQYKPDESLTIMKFVSEALVDGWWMSDWGLILHRKYREKQKLELHTGGWSGNEETISAILSNVWLTSCFMKHVMWRTGGHYYFEIDTRTK